jgi:hypothetical protein
MALDDFMSDDSEKNSTSDTVDSASGSTQGSPTNNTPSETRQMFIDHPDVTPRAIKYQVKSYGCKWISQFSTRRTDKGELVMYASPFEKFGTSKTVMVFTTITSITNPEREHVLDNIWVTVWDLENREPIGDGIRIKDQEGWRKKLKNAVVDEIERRSDILYSS